MTRAALAALLLAANAAAADPSLPGPPDGYAPFAEEEGRRVHLPVGQADPGWREKLTYWRRASAQSDPLELVAEVTAPMKAACPESFDLEPVPENTWDGGETLSIHLCPEPLIDGRPELFVLRVVAEDGMLWGIQKSWATALPPREDLDRWTEWAQSHAVCDGLLLPEACP